jgi:predicted nuclease of predicted toxin-antitoxin system
MLRLLADENIEIKIVRGLLRRKPDLDIVRIQEVGLSGVDDQAVLEWAAQEGRILLTHDKRTMTKFAYERVTKALPMPGVLEIKRSATAGQVIEAILLIAERGFENEWENQVIYIPQK